MQTAILIIMRVLECLFFIGLAGSAIVVAISFVEDLAVLLNFERKAPPASADFHPKRRSAHHPENATAQSL